MLRCFPSEWFAPLARRRSFARNPAFASGAY